MAKELTRLQLILALTLLLTQLAVAQEIVNVSNPSFELQGNPIGWGIFGNATPVSVGAYSGTQSVLVGNASWGYFYQTFSATAGNTFVVDEWFRGNASSQQARLQISFLNSSGGGIASVICWPFATSAWQEFSCAALAPASTSFARVFAISGNSPAKAFVDDVTLWKTNSSFPVLNSNPGFEVGASYWQTSSNNNRGFVKIDSSIKKSGNYSLKIFSNASNGLQGPFATTSFIRVIPGRAYLFEAFVKASNVVGQANVDVLFYNSSYALVASKRGFKQVNGTMDWTRLSLAATTPTNAVYAKMQLTIYGNGTAWFDDTQVKQIVLVGAYNPGFELQGTPRNWTRLGNVKTYSF